MFSLHYFNSFQDHLSVTHSDYKSISSAVTPLAVVNNGLPNSGDWRQTGKDLFNGNIRAMLVNIPKFTTSSAQEGARLYGYRYDQLNRIKAMNAYSGLDVSTNVLTPAVMNDYRERVSYDPNGNILTYNRNGNTATARPLAEMDELTYHYLSGSNKLGYVTDAVSSSYTTDIQDLESQSAGNYDYDAIGNLTKDVAEGIGANGITWNVYGKIASVTKTVSGITTTINYIYDAGGNRIGKQVQAGSNITNTWYVRDASGNVIAVYENNNSSLNTGKLSQTELHLFGSNRLGLWQAGRDVESTNWWQFNTTAMPGTTNGGVTENWQRGKAGYELSNHLGNVLVTVSDKKTGIDSDTDGDIDYYMPNILTANDYYPFGMGMPGRKYSATGSYRFGFNGKENDKETSSTTTYDYGFRVYNPAIGRFLSVDPLSQSYPWYTPYQFASNSPILNIDLDGLESKSTQPNTSGNKVEEMLETLSRAIEREEKIVKDAKNLLKQADQIEVKVNVLFQRNVANKKKIDALKSDFQKGNKKYEDFKALDEIWKNMTYDASVLEGIQAGLDLAGTAPIVGEAADGLNGLGYLFQLKWEDAGTSFAGMVPFLGNVATAKRLSKLEGAGVALKCVDYANDFAKKFTKSLTLAGYTVSKYTLKAGSDYGIAYAGKSITDNGTHIFTEVMKDGKKFIFDNEHGAGIPYHDFIKKLEVVLPGGGFATGEEAYKLATKTQ